MAKNKNKLHRLFVYLKSNFSCCNCALKFDIPKNWNMKNAIHNGYIYLEIDHIVPTSKGGNDTLNNKQALCAKCNKLKSNKI